MQVTVLFVTWTGGIWRESCRRLRIKTREPSSLLSTFLLSKSACESEVRACEFMPRDEVNHPSFMSLRQKHNQSQNQIVLKDNLQTHTLSFGLGVRQHDRKWICLLSLCTQTCIHIHRKNTKSTHTIVYL